MTSPENLGHQFDSVIGDQFPDHLPDGVRQAVQRVEKGRKVSDGTSRALWYDSKGEDGFFRTKPFLYEHTTHPAVVQALSRQGRLHEIVNDLDATGRINHPDVHRAMIENEIVRQGKSLVDEAQDIIEDTNKDK